MTEQEIKVYVNMFGVLKNLEVLPELDKETKTIIQNVNKVLVISVENGPSVQVSFANGEISISNKKDTSDVSFIFNSSTEFNKMFSEAAPPSSIKGSEDGEFIAVVHKVMTRLAYFLTPDPKNMQDNEFVDVFSRFTLQTLFHSVAQSCMFDETAKAITSHIPDGSMKIVIGTDIIIIVTGKNGEYSSEFKDCQDPIGILEFKSLAVAMGFIQGQVNFREAIPLGDMNIMGHVMAIATFLSLLPHTGKYLG